MTTRNRFKFKKGVTEEEEKRIMKDELLNLDSLTTQRIIYHHSIIFMRTVCGFNIEKIRNYLKKKYSDEFDELLFGSVSKYVKARHSLAEYRSKTPLVDVHCCNHINNYIKEEDLLYDKGKRRIDVKELAYYYYRLSKILFQSNGYDQKPRNYFCTNEGFREDWKKATKKVPHKNKLCVMNRILNKYNLIKIYSVKKKINLFVVGENNPLYLFKGIMEDTDKQKVQDIIKESEYRQVRATYKDKKIEELEKQVKALEKEKGVLEKQVKQKEEEIRAFHRDQEFVDEIIREKAELQMRLLKIEAEETKENDSCPDYDSEDWFSESEVVSTTESNEAVRNRSW
ncbi:MAG: hypothetical protein ACYSR0_04310 [Planctomycetota bacterium]|jgi:hypothetical protein